MSIQVSQAMFGQLNELQYEPIERWIRATLDGQDVLDSKRAMLVWEPRRVVPSYAVPIGDLAATLVPAEAAPPSDSPILHPGIPFVHHSTPGTSLDLVVGDRTLPGVGFEPDELPGYVVVDFSAFERWREEADEVVSHPRSPYHCVEIRPSTRHVRISLDGTVLAESTRPVLVFETMLMTRFYLPREDVLASLTISPTATACAYKGRATHYTVVGRKDLAWSYLEPLPEVARLAGLVAFYDEKVDVTVDGVLRDKPRGPIADAMRAEFAMER
jgi:uncharacterized protein (DUF427 family)